MAQENYPTVVTFVGANGRLLTFAAKESDGTAYDLTDLTVKINARLADGTQKINDKTCSVTDASAGEFEYQPTAAELDAANKYTAQVKLIDGSSNVDFLEMFYIDVRAPITESA